jgi:hypothetical protein
MTTSADSHDPGVVDLEDLGSQGLSRRQVLARIGVGGAVLWASPMLSNVALAGPTSCHPVTLDWDSYAVGSSFTSATLLGNTISFAAASFNGTSALAGNRTVVAGPQGGINQRFYRLNQNAVTNAYQTLTINFSYAVYNVSFTITDIDNQNNAWTDRVGFTPAPTSFSTPGYGSGARVLGGGTLANPFYNAANNTNLDNNSNRGNVTVTWAGPVTSIALRFWCAGEDGSNQLINIGDISFCV